MTARRTIGTAGHLGAVYQPRGHRVMLLIGGETITLTMREAAALADTLRVAVQIGRREHPIQIAAVQREIGT